MFSPCGVAGGNPFGCPVGDPELHDCPGGGFSNGEAFHLKLYISPL